MPRFVRHEIHPLNPQVRLLDYAATQLRAGAIAALPMAAGYALACQLDDKAATNRLRRSAGVDERAPVALLCRDVAQASACLHVDDRAFRPLRDASDGTTAFVLRSTRQVPRRLTAEAGGACLLHFAGHAVAQALLDMLDEPLLIALPAPSQGGAVRTVDDLPARWHGVLDVALDAGPLPDARAVNVVDLHGLLQARPSLSRWGGTQPALA